MPTSGGAQWPPRIAMEGLRWDEKVAIVELPGIVKCIIAKAFSVLLCL